MEASSSPAREVARNSECKPRSHVLPYKGTTELNSTSAARRWGAAKVQNPNTNLKGELSVTEPHLQTVS